jgi:hypothetical protein
MKQERENLKSRTKSLNNQKNLNKIPILSIKKNINGNKIQKEKGEFTLLIPNFNTKIHKELYINEKEILISKKIVQRLSDGKNNDIYYFKLIHRFNII